MKPRTPQLVVVCLGMAVLASSVEGRVASAADLPANIMALRYRLVLNRVLGGAQTSAKSMQLSLAAASAQAKVIIPGGDKLFPKLLEEFAARANNNGANMWRKHAVKCYSLTPAAGEDNATFIARAAGCLTDSIGTTSSAAGVAQIRNVVRQLAKLAQSFGGGAKVRAVLPRIGRMMPAGVAESILISAELRTMLVRASDLAARAFGQRATPCAALALKANETTTAFTQRVGECLTAVGEGAQKESVDSVLAKSLDHLINTGIKGTISLRRAVDQAVSMLDDRIDRFAMYPESLRAALKDANALVATAFIRGARRCRRVIRGPNQTPPEFVKMMGACLVQGVAEAMPVTLVALTLGAVKTVAEGAAKGPALLRQALTRADNMLRGRVPPGEVFSNDVRRNIMLGNAAWVANFAKLVPTCQVREFKKNHRFDEFVIRVNMCVSSASSGLTAAVLQARILQSMRTVASSGYRGARELRLTLQREIAQLEKVMRVTDLYPDAWKASMRELSDSSARAYAPLGVKCADLRRGGDAEGLGQYVKRLAACQEAARVSSGGDALARKVRESVQSLVDAALTSSGVLRNAMGPAINLLGGLVPPDQLYPRALQSALALATDDMATRFARDGRTCINIERAPNGPFLTYIESVARCLTGTTTAALDQQRQIVVKDVVQQLATLADGGPASLLGGYPRLYAKMREALPLPGTYVQQLNFAERTAEFGKRIRASCVSLPASNPTEVNAVRACLDGALAAAMAIQPPDACRGKPSAALLECCLADQNRLLPSCSAHRYACRTGEVWQNNTCRRPAAVAAPQSMQCPPGQEPSGTGICVTTPCQPGQIRNSLGVCAIAGACPNGGELDFSGKCLIVSCPPGSQLDISRRCVSGSCPLGKIQVGLGVCAQAQCPFGANIDGQGRCVTPVLAQPGFAPPGLLQPGFPQPGFVQPGFVQPGLVQTGGYVQPAVLGTPTLIQQSCPHGTVLQGNTCARSFCPPGTVLNQFGQCMQGSCPLGTQMTITGQCSQ